MPRLLWLAWLMILAVTLLIIDPRYSVPQSLQAQSASGADMSPVSMARAQLTRAGPDSAGGVALSAREVEALVQRKLQLREQMYANAAPEGAAVDGLAAAPAAASRLAGSAPAAQVHGAESTLFFGRNFRNTRANLANGLTSVLAEPAGAGNGPLVYMAGNLRHAERSTNGGLTWVDVPLPLTGPAEAPILCCDHDVKYDDARRMLLHSYLYITSSASNGVVRFDVRRNFLGTPNCSFVLNPAGTNVLPDFPHIMMTKNFLFISSNTITGGVSQVAQMFRFPLAPIFDCATSVAGAVTNWPFTIEGQKVWAQTEGVNIRGTMWWAHRTVIFGLENLRIFRWPDSSAVATQALRPIAAGSILNPDCRGGANNSDYVSGLNVSRLGFNLRVAVGVNHLQIYFPVGRDGLHTQGHIHGAIIALNGSGDPDAPLLGSVLAQPVIFNNAFCFSFPHHTKNKLGHTGMVLAAGGRAGGGGIAQVAAAGIDDDFNPGLGNFGTFFIYAAGTHNAPIFDRFGDYFAIHPDEPCEKWFVATGYAYLNGTLVTNVNSRWLEFGRNRYLRCWQDYRNLQPVSR